MATVYGSLTHFLDRTANFHYGNLTDLQVSHTECKNSTLLTPNPTPNTCATTQPVPTTCLPKLQCTLLSQFRACKTPLTYLDAAAANKTSWTVAYFIPVSLHIDEDADKESDERIAEQVLGEEVEHLTKIKTTNKIICHLNSHGMVMTFLGNYHCFPQVVWDIKAVRPIFVMCIKELADAMREPNIRR